MSLDAHLQQRWYGAQRPASWWLPLSWLFGAVVAARRWAYRVGLFATIKLSRPVIVVGNITVGGTGKTPLVIWLANTLSAQGHAVGIVTRGYGGQAKRWPQAVRADSDPALVGDEAVLMAQQTQARVYAGPDRVAAAHAAIATGAQVILSDDGLQHYRLHRDLELAVVDASRMFGNGYLLPAGPLREPPRRLQEVALVLSNQRGQGQVSLTVPHLRYRVELTHLRALRSGEQQPLSLMSGRQVHVVTAIGNPQSFLHALTAQGIRSDARLLPDHARLNVDDIEFGDSLPVLMTEKDAVKCRRFASHRHWAVGATVVFDADDEVQLLQRLAQVLPAMNGLGERLK